MSKPPNDQSAPITHNADRRDRLEAIVRQALVENWVEEIMEEINGERKTRRNTPLENH